MHLSLGIYKMPPVVKVRTWIATLNGADEEVDYSLWMERLVTSGVVKFICGQLERGEQEGRLHLQYMVQLERSRRLSHLRTAICNRSHWEPVYGSNLQAKAYCTKKRPGFPAPGNMVVYHASVSAEAGGGDRVRQGAFRCTWSQRSSLWPGCLMARD